jgi:hypothetical protein
MRFTYESIARSGTRLQTARALENLRGARCSRSLAEAS